MGRTNLARADARAQPACRLARRDQIPRSGGHPLVARSSRVARSRARHRRHARCASHR